MRMEIWNPVRCSSAVEVHGTRKVVGGVSFSHTQMCVYASTRFTLLSKEGPVFGFTARIQLMSLWWALLKFVASLGVANFACFSGRFRRSRKWDTACIVILGWIQRVKSIGGTGDALLWGLKVWCRCILSARTVPPVQFSLPFALRNVRLKARHTSDPLS